MLDLDFSMLEAPGGPELLIECARCKVLPEPDKGHLILTCPQCKFTVRQSHPDDTRRTWNLVNNVAGLDLYSP